MTEKGRTRLAWALAIGSLILIALSIAVKASFGILLDADDSPLLIPAILGVVAVAIVGALIAGRTGNAIGWIFLAIVGTFAVSTNAQNWIDAGADRSLPFLGVADWLSTWPFFISLGLLIAVFYLFPTGRIPSARWRWPWRAYVTAFVVTVVGFAVQPYSHPVGDVVVTNPVGVEPLDTALGFVLAVAGFAMVASAFISVASLIVRARGADPETRQQLRWLGAVGRLGGALFLLLLTAGFASSWGESGWVATVADVTMVLFVATIALGIPAATSVAILKHRLYDLNVVIRRTVIVTMMAVTITALYAAIVIAVPLFIGGAGAGGLDLLPLIAAAIVAIAFEPLRRAARRLADRLVYGERATPYEVLTAFSERVGESYSSDNVLPRMVQVLALGTGASAASVWLRVGSELRREVWWPEESAGSRAVSLGGDELPSFEGESGYEVRHQGELLGALTVAMPPNDPMDPAKEKLVEDLAAQAGLVLRNVRLIEELRASRQRLVAAQDEERRRLERNIHDGVQQQLVALSVQLRLAEQLTERDPGKARTMLETLQGQTTQALEDLRDLARGIYPPLLADKGLGAALEAQARKAAVPTKVESDGIARYPRDVEAAVYFSALEALNNVAKYAHATRSTVTIGQRDGHLLFAVTDDGNGFEPAGTTYGTGLQGIADRLDSIGGILEITSEPGLGTTVAGRVPLDG